MTTAPLKIGDRVQVGKGSKTWQILELWPNPADDQLIATLLPDGGYSRTSVPVDRLTLVERA